MVKLGADGFESGLDLFEVRHPLEFGANVPLDVQADSKGMSVYAPAFVAFRATRQPVRGFERELLKDLQPGHTGTDGLPHENKPNTPRVV